MTERGRSTPDEVALRRHNRLEISFDESEATAAPAASVSPPSAAALLYRDRRVPIPAGGLTVGRGTGASIQVHGRGVAESQAIVKPGPEGLTVTDLALGRTFVNGERLVPGAQRTLGQGDTIAVGGELIHVVTGQTQLRPLAPITPVDAGRIRAGGATFSIGRAVDNDLVLDHPTVSRHHALIRSAEGRAMIEDRGSAAGLRVNGEATRRAALEPGDQIAIGPFRILFDGTELVQRSAASGLPILAAGVEVRVPIGLILHSTDLQLRPGELVAFVGESGAGKSTLLKALAGVDRPTGGRVLAGGEDVCARLSEIGYVPQFDIVHGRLTVTEALDYAAQLRLPADLSADERGRRVAEVIDQLGLSERAGQLVDRLSGGQRKRVAVGIELLHRPGALFLDEPTTGLDPGLERRMMELFRSLASSGQTVALVTHATASISLCDRVVVMGRGGHVCFDGTPAEALTAFGVESFDEVYVKLADGDAAAIAAQRASRSVQQAPALPPVLAERARAAITQPTGHQIRVLASRYAKLMTRDRRHLRSALIQVPILGLLTALLFSSTVFQRLGSTVGPHQLATAKAAQLIFLMVTIAIWLGAINAAREIVKERSVVARELAVGVRIPAYLASKLVVLLVLALAQTVLFAAIVLVLRPLHEAGGGGLRLIAVLVISSWIAVMMGLVVSALAASEDQATGVIPLLLVPQLLLGGAIVTIHEMPGVMKLISALVPARWSFAAAGHAIHLQQRIAEDPQFSRASKYGPSFFQLRFSLFIFIALIFAGVLFALLVRRLNRDRAGATDG